MQDLEAENKILKQALDKRRLERKQKALHKAQKKMELLQMKVRLQAAEAEYEELRGAARQVPHDVQTQCVGSILPGL